jgi:hypothetical protein
VSKNKQFIDLDIQPFYLISSKPFKKSALRVNVLFRRPSKLQILDQPLIINSFGKPLIINSLKNFITIRI